MKIEPQLLSDFSTISGEAQKTLFKKVYSRGKVKEKLISGNLSLKE